MAAMDHQRQKIPPSVADVEAEPKPTVPLVPRGLPPSDKPTPTLQPKIHPPATDVEAEPKPTVPLVPRGLPLSDKPTPTLQPKIHPSATDVEAGPKPTVPLVPRGLPTVQPKPRHCSWSKVLCWTIIILVLILIALAATAAIIYFVFRPKLPSYSVERLRVTDLSLGFDMSLYARFEVRVAANNPNEKIGIYYKKGGTLSVWYAGARLCEGPLPSFYQGHENRTVLDVALSGQSPLGSSLMQAMRDQQERGSIPLDLRVSAPVAVKLGRLKMRKVRVLGDCLLVVDTLSTNDLISIKASDCKFRLKL